MSKMTKILLIIMAVSLVPLGMLGAMLYFGGTADSPAGGTIDLGKAADTADGGRYTGASGGTINGNVSYGTGDSTTDGSISYGTGDSTTDGSISYGTVNSTTDGNISDAADADSTGMDVTQTTDDNDYSSFYVSELPDSVWKNMQGKSYKDGCPVERKDLRYVHVMFVDFADMRFDFIERLCEQTVVKPKESKERIRSEKIDRILTGKYTAIPCFIVIMILVFYLTFNVIGAWLQGLLELGIGRLTELADAAMTAAHVNSAVQSLVIDGIFTGVGSVLSFLPIVVTLFFFLSLMEDSGYIARVAFVMDKLLRKIGLSGRSIVPMLIGFGCTVPAVMATRTLTSERDRKMTILLTPFMSCSAKLPIYSFFVSVFFPGKGGLIMSALYLLGIVIGILVAFLYRGTLFKGEPVPFVMELPNYRLPGAKNVGQLLWEKAKDFLQKAFTVIFIATIVVWFLQSFDLKLNLVENSANSMLAMLSGLLVPVFRPLGLGDWRICTSLISGFMAKESVVATLEVLFGSSIATVLTPLAAASLLVFSLLYTPCVAAIASVRRELGGKWAIAVVLWQCFVAWVAAFLVHGIGMLLG